MAGLVSQDWNTIKSSLFNMYKKLKDLDQCTSQARTKHTKNLKTIYR